MSGPRFAIVTPSYRGDIERCRLLCAGVDHFVTGLSTHYLLVEDQDLSLFRKLEGPRRRVIAESELLPRWLSSWPDPLSLGRRRIWTGAGALARGVPPLRGWHTQQLRKLALPRLVDEEVLLFADADVILLRPLDLANQIVEGRPRLYRVSGGLTQGMARHRPWVEHASRALGLGPPRFPADDYINNLVTWTSAHGRGLLARLEEVSGRDWVSAVARGGRNFSEWLLYGFYVDQILGEGAGLAHTSRPLARTYWFTEDVAHDSFAEAAELMEPDQVAVGVQSFIGVPMEALWSLFRRHAGGRAPPLRAAP